MKQKRRRQSLKCFSSASMPFFGGVEEKMHLVAFILFLLPSSLLGAAWNRVLKDATEPLASGWRRYCTILGLTTGNIATSITLYFLILWFHNAGSSNGLDPVPGLWQILGPVLKYSDVATALLAIAGEGKGRLLLVASAAANLFVMFMLLLLEMQ